jgi:hypothetical protein
MPENNDIRIVFLDIGLFDQGSAIRGGLLITDLETRPYEFRCTSAVKPTPLQRVLYGDTLDEYVNVELIALPLLAAAKEKPTVVLVRLPLLLTVRTHLAYPVVLIRVEPSPAAAGTIRPVVLTAHRNFPTEGASVQAMLAPVMQRRDLAEPFNRLSVALIEAHKQNIGDTASGAKRA